jgi:hypothetical protein
MSLFSILFKKIKRLSSIKKDEGTMKQKARYTPRRATIGNFLKIVVPNN